MSKSANSNGLDIQKSYICVAQFDPREVAVRQVAVQPLTAVLSGEGDYWKSVAAELRGIRKKIRFAGRDVACSLPCEGVVVKTLEAPSDELNQDDSLRWELEANLAGPAGEYAFDFYEIDPGDLVDRRRYLAAAARSETVGKLKKAMKAVNLNPYIIDIDLFALTHVFQANYRERMAEASALVHGEYNCTKIILVRNSSYVDYAVFDFDAEGRGEAAYTAALNDELGRLTSRNGLTRDGAGVFLAGSLFTDERFAASALSGVLRCEALDPFRRVTCAAGMDEAQLKVYSPQLAVAVGLALRGDEA